ncbi:MAG TPA: hypothetical protein QGF08_05240 [Candidatus Marinimicrobia bacterium]|jgi:hypothetical protein|nr:hypothetical protein [Candidatus Neomarinimicrobiota bacterium]MDP7217627.1 hypothetical protein [Candidatus Neomarinimicrobiota bacterium]MDP7436527.1 hypothetical protein [Candidatus Neomarinimicrobiota bacterium]HBN45988.1 hypothetical protein [Candidatus Neomarinimicrobiota bacterium]HJL74125.1 hypothetical protein [Candidatus Neomarinimicrobiota bacterium]|tara:strand:- start:4607 stop:4993 length:387 start_codon:yes stop_codon:yes gene_type:complete
MKKLCFFLLLSGLFAGQPLQIDIRPRIVDDKTVSIVVQIDNKSKRSINHLEGFLTVITDGGEVLEEKRLIIIGPLDPVLQHNRTVSKNVKLDLVDPFPAYRFNVSKITFSGDYKVYTYHPEIGFYRID